MVAETVMENRALIQAYSSVVIGIASRADGHTNRGTAIVESKSSKSASQRAKARCIISSVVSCVGACHFTLTGLGIAVVLVRTEIFTD